MTSRTTSGRTTPGVTCPGSSPCCRPHRRWLSAVGDSVLTGGVARDFDSRKLLQVHAHQVRIIVTRQNRLDYVTSRFARGAVMSRSDNVKVGVSGPKERRHRSESARSSTGGGSERTSSAPASSAGQHRNSSARTSSTPLAYQPRLPARMVRASSAPPPYRTPKREPQPDIGASSLRKTGHSELG